MRRKALRRWWRSTTAIVLVYRLRSARHALDEALSRLAWHDEILADARQFCGMASDAPVPQTSLQWVNDARLSAIEDVRHWLDINERLAGRYFVNALYGLHAEGR